jgi:acyl-CoA synthetase (AMP-forming)/AMP-acid ligase II
MSDAGAEVTPGQEGELQITGGSVMPGYWNQPQLSAGAFLADASGTAWYRTGDMVRDEGEGSYVFVGRKDRMVKRRGYRVELGEIESALYRHPSIAEAAVVALPDPESGVRVRAFLNWTDEAPPSTIAMKQFCADNLPAYMIPDQFSVLPSLPRTSTDKVDYRQLEETT